MRRIDVLKLEELIKVCRWMNTSGLSPATSGNYSIRGDKEDTCFVSASGVDKGNLRVADFLEFSLREPDYNTEIKPSDEAPIHVKLLQMHADAECVLHAHSVTNTIIGLIYADAEYIEFSGFEMQKAFTGIKTHEEPIRVPIIDNTQDIMGLAETFDGFELPCFILRGHGVYVWGNSVWQAKRHLEGLEFLIECKLAMRRYM